MNTRNTKWNERLFNTQLMASASVVLVTGLTIAPAMADVDKDADLNAAADTTVHQPADEQAELDASADVDGDENAELSAEADLDTDAEADLDASADAEAQSDEDLVDGNHGELELNDPQAQADSDAVRVQTTETQVSREQVDANQYELLDADQQQNMQRQQRSQTQQAQTDQDYDPRQQYDFIIGEEDSIQSIPEGNLPPNEQARNQRLASPESQTQYRTGDSQMQRQQQRDNANRQVELRRQSPAGFGDEPTDAQQQQNQRNVFESQQNRTQARTQRNNQFNARQDARIYRDQNSGETYVIEENGDDWDQDVEGNHGELIFDEPTRRYRVVQPQRQQQASPQDQTRYQANQSDFRQTDQSQNQQGQQQNKQAVEMQIIDSKIIDSSSRRSQTLGSVERQNRVQADQQQMRQIQRDRRNLNNRPDSRVIELRRQSPSGYVDHQANSRVDDDEEITREARDIQQGSQERNQQFEADAEADLNWERQQQNQSGTDLEAEAELDANANEADENWDTQVEGNQGELRLDDQEMNDEIGTGDLETRANADQIEAEAQVDSDPNVTQELGAEADVDVDADLDAEPTENNQM